MVSDTGFDPGIFGDEGGGNLDRRQLASGRKMSHARIFRRRVARVGGILQPGKLMKEKHSQNQSPVQ